MRSYSVINHHVNDSDKRDVSARETDAFERYDVLCIY